MTRYANGYTDVRSGESYGHPGHRRREGKPTPRDTEKTPQSRGRKLLLGRCTSYSC